MKELSSEKKSNIIILLTCILIVLSVLLVPTFIGELKEEEPFSLKQNPLLAIQAEEIVRLKAVNDTLKLEAKELRKLTIRSLESITFLLKPNVSDSTVKEALLWIKER